MYHLLKDLFPFKIKHVLVKGDYGVIVNVLQQVKKINIKYVIEEPTKYFSKVIELNAIGNLNPIGKYDWKSQPNWKKISTQLEKINLTPLESPLLI